MFSSANSSRAMLANFFTLAAMLIGMTAHASDIKVPAELKKIGEFRVGVKCDAPPYGFLDQQGKPTGIDIDFSRHIAELAFGNADKAVFTCVTTSTRAQMLTSGKVDVLIATVGVTEERRKTMDFTTSDSWGGSGILVRSDSTARSLEDFNGKVLLTNKGGWAAAYLERNYPKITLTKFDSLTDAIQALRQGRGDGVTQDVGPLISAAEKGTGLKMTDISFQIGWEAPAVRRGDTALRLFMNDMVSRAKIDGTFIAILKKYVSPPLLPLMIKQYTTLPPDGSSDENRVNP